MKRFWGILFMSCLFGGIYCSEANGVCMQFTYDVNGNLISQKCGGDNPAFNCEKPLVWDGHQCVKSPVISSCESAGGEWVNTQFSYSLPQVSRRYKFISACKCPQNMVWNGRNCANVSENNICVSTTDKCVAVSKGFFAQNIGSIDFICSAQCGN